MKKIKNVGIIMLAMACMATAGCGGGGDSDNPSGSTNANTNTSFFEDIPAELDGTTVTFATWIDHNSNESATVLSDFTDITGIKVEILHIPQMEYVSKLSALVASGESPDVAVSNSEWPRILPILSPLENTKVNPSDEFWDQEVVKSYTIGGHSYLVNVREGAWDMGSACVYYNKRIFEDNGITTPDLYSTEKRWTLENFFKAAKELKAAIGCGVGIDVHSFTSAYSDGFVTWDSESASFKSNINQPEFISAWQMMAEARDGGYAEVSDGGTRWMFEQQKMGMLLTGAYGLRKTGWFSNDIDTEDLGFVLLPRVEASSEQIYGRTGERGYGICNGAKNPDGAAYFLRYFLDADNYEEDELYKNEESMELYKELQANKKSGIDSTYAILRMFNPDSSSPLYEVFPELKDCTASQISSVLASNTKTFDSCIAKANQLLQASNKDNQ